MLGEKTEPTDKKIVLNILIVVGVSILILAGIIAFAIYKLYSGYKDYETARITYEDARKEYVIVNRPETSSDTSGDGLSGSIESTQNVDDAQEVEWYNIVDVNIAGLKSVNSDVCGWIYFEDEEISYPIMYSGDNSKYLDHDYTGAYSRCGAIFVDGENKIDFSDAHTLIYGHNMRDMSMFGKLSYYKTDEDYYETHKYIQVILNDKKIRYEIMAYMDVPADGNIYQVYPSGVSGFTGFVNNYIARYSYINAGIDVSDSDKIITLSTCSASDDIRFVVSAIKIDEH